MGTRPAFHAEHGGNQAQTPSSTPAERTRLEQHPEGGRTTGARQCPTTGSMGAAGCSGGRPHPGRGGAPPRARSPAWAPAHLSVAPIPSRPRDCGWTAITGGTLAGNIRIHVRAPAQRRGHGRHQSGHGVKAERHRQPVGERTGNQGRSICSVDFRRSSNAGSVSARRLTPCPETLLTAPFPGHGGRGDGAPLSPSNVSPATGGEPKKHLCEPRSLTAREGGWPWSGIPVPTSACGTAGQQRLCSPATDQVGLWVAAPPPGPPGFGARRPARAPPMGKAPCSCSIPPAMGPSTGTGTGQGPWSRLGHPFVVP